MKKRQNTQLLWIVWGWMTCLLQCSAAFDCPNSVDIRCFCEKPPDLGRTCYTAKRHFLLFKAESLGEHLKLTCPNEDSLDDFFNITIPHTFKKLHIYECGFTEEWTKQFRGSFVTSLYLNETNDLYFETNNILLKELTNLHELTITGLRIEDLPSHAFDKHESLNYLDLEHNHLMNLPEDLFSRLKKLFLLNLNSNDLLNLPDGLFSGLSELQVVCLSNNNIRFLPNSLFLDLVSLKHLFLQNNEIDMISEDMFYENRGLQKLYLQGNRLKKLPPNLLYSMKWLHTLDISSNPFEVIPNDFLSNQTSLREFYFNNCSLTSISDNLLQDTTEVTVVSMKKNVLGEIKSTWFRRTIWLNQLDLSDNNICRLNGSLFQNKNALENLNLSKNKISNISGNNFLGLKILKILNISHNNLANIEENAFRDLEKLHTLDLSYNGMHTVLQYFNIGQLKSLSYLNVSGNGITDLLNLRSIKFNINLKELRLEANNITTLTVPEIFSSGESSTRIYLQHNSINFINVSLLRREHLEYKFHGKGDMNSHRKKLIFHLRNNPLVCDCELYHFYTYTRNRGIWSRYAEFYDEHELRCNSPTNLRGQHVMNLQPENFTCSVTEECPSECTCAFRKCDETVTVNCTGQMMETLPDIIPRNATILHMEGNRLTGLGELNRMQFRELKEIYVDENDLSSENSHQWFIPPDLLMLSMKGNQLSALPEPVKIHTERVKDFRMNLANNSWRCDCSALELKKWLSDHYQQILDIDEILCSLQMEEHLMATADRILCPGNLSNYSSRIKVFMVLIIIAIVFCFIASVYFFRRKKVNNFSVVYKIF